MVFISILLFYFSVVFGASHLEIQALVDLYNACNGPAWSNNNNWSPNPVSDPCNEYTPWKGVTCDGNPQYISELQLPSNKLKGTIPSSIVNLNQLRILDLSINSLDGTIPENLYLIPTLTHLQLQINNISGTISSNIGKLQSLFILSFGINSLSGTIPDSFYSLTNLQQMDLSLNQLSGTISDSVGGMTSIQLFLVSSNVLTGTIPSSFGNIPQLARLQLTTNKFTGTIPETLCKVPSLVGLWLNNFKVFGGGLHGSIPSCIGGLSSLQYLFLSGNYLAQGVPPEIFNLTQLQQLFLGDNALSGTIPDEVGNLGTNITLLDISQAGLSGTIPASIGLLTSLTYLNLATNQLTGSIPNSINSLTQLTQLQLQATYGSGNTLTGTIPSGIFHFPNMQILLLANNRFSGSIPADFGLLQLEELDLTGTQLSGFLPYNLFGNRKLTMLYLANNKFMGSLDYINRLDKLQFLTLNDNLLSGFVPNYFQNTKFGIPANSVLHNNPFLCPLPAWAPQTTGASCQVWKITSLSPPYGDTIFDTQVMVNGTNFQNLDVDCNFGDISSPATLISSTSLSCTAPATYNTSRVVNFTLSYEGTNFALTSIQTFAYLGVPVISSILPNTGREQGFVKVTITGSNFFASPQWNLVYCLIGDIFVPGTYIDETRIECETPPKEPGTVQVSVSIDGNISIGNLDVSFTYFEYCDGLPLACLGSGVCDTSVSPPKCICNTNFIGNICQDCEHLFYGPQCLQCPDCGVNGSCNATIIGNGLCVCEPGFYGTNCKQCPACAHGRCLDGQLGTGKCKCDTLWAGELCNSRWQLYVIIIAPSVVIIAIVVTLFIKFRRSKREYRNKKGKSVSTVAE